MTSPTPRRNYAPVPIAIHWLMVALIASVYACMLLSGNFPRGSDMRAGLQTWHFMLGLTVLALVLVRIIARLFTARPPITPTPPAWQKAFAKVTHLALYGFMLAMPILGWMILSAAGQTIPFWGLDLPALVGKSKNVAGQAKEIHETIATIGYFLIGLHASAALYHHYLAKDDTLRRMLPGARNVEGKGRPSST